MNERPKAAGATALPAGVSFAGAKRLPWPKPTLAAGTHGRCRPPASPGLRGAGRSRARSPRRSPSGGSAARTGPWSRLGERGWRGSLLGRGVRAEEERARRRRSPGPAGPDLHAAPPPRRPPVPGSRRLRTPSVAPQAGPAQARPRGLLCAPLIFEARASRSVPSPGPAPSRVALARPSRFPPPGARPAAQDARRDPAEARCAPLLGAAASAAASAAPAATAAE